MRALRFALLAALAIFVFAPTAPVAAKTKPGKLHKDYVYGYRMVIPAKWDRVPPKTRETVAVGAWYGRATRVGRPEMSVLRFEKATAVATGDGEEGADDEPLTLEEQIRRLYQMGKAKTFDEWLDDRLSRFEDLPPQFKQRYPDFSVSKETLRPLTIAREKRRILEIKVENGGPYNFVMLVAIIENASTQFAVTATCSPDDYAKQHKAGFLACMKSFKFLEVKDDADVDYDAAFEAEEGEDRDEAEQRRWVAQIKKSIDNVKEWDHLSTKNYLIVYDRGVKAKHVKMIGVQIEAIRRDVYEILFPAADPITAISVVRVCKNREQYGAYGGPGGSAGYWSPGEKELVFYFEGRDPLRVLYHEAFHQYIHYAFGSFAPHSWFNEGHGDYFAGFNYRGRFKPDRFEWRRGIIKSAIATDKTVPLKEFLHYTQRQYYARSSLCYAQGWALVYFLRHTRNKAYRAVLPKYFDALQEGLSGTEVEGMEGARNPRRTAEALKNAVEKAFEGIDLEKLEADFLDFKY